MQIFVVCAIIPARANFEGKQLWLRILLEHDLLLLTFIQVDHEINKLELGLSPNFPLILTESKRIN